MFACLSVDINVMKPTQSMSNKFATNILSSGPIWMTKKPFEKKNPFFGKNICFYLSYLFITFLGQKYPLDLPKTWFKPHTSKNGRDNLVSTIDW